MYSIAGNTLRRTLARGASRSTRVERKTIATPSIVESAASKWMSLSKRVRKGENTLKSILCCPSEGF